MARIFCDTYMFNFIEVYHASCFLRLTNHGRVLFILKVITMQHLNIALQGISLVGLKIRTNNRNETNQETSKIAKLIRQYREHNVAAHLLERKNPGTTYCVYTHYESDEQGDYTYFVGEEASTHASTHLDLSPLHIPGGVYAKLTTGPGSIPTLCINAWKHIWNMSETELGGKRNYHTDFEIYDARAANASHAVFDIYVGLQ